MRYLLFSWKYSLITLRRRFHPWRAWPHPNFPSDSASQHSSAWSGSHSHKGSAIRSTGSTEIKNFIIICHLPWFRRNFVICLIIVRRADDVEEEVNVTLVETGEAIEHDDFGVRTVCLAEEALLEGLLFLGRWESVSVEVFGQNPIPIVVHYNHALQNVESGILQIKPWTILRPVNWLRSRSAVNVCQEPGL